MPKRYLKDLRDRVLADYDRGKQTKEIAGHWGSAQHGSGESSRFDVKNSEPRGYR